MILLYIFLQVHNQTSRRLTRCQCTHLTWFGADLFIPPNKLDIRASIKKLADIHKHPALLATFCVITGLYILGLVWARRKDRKDITKVSIVNPLSPKGVTIFQENIDCFTIGTIHWRSRFIKKEPSLLIVRKIIILSASLDCFC